MLRRALDLVARSVPSVSRATPSDKCTWSSPSMPRKVLVAVSIFAVVLSAIACRQHKYHERSTAADLAATVLDIASGALLGDDGGPKWDELDRRLDNLFANNTREADEAVVILVRFYLGEHECEEVHEFG